MSEDGGESWHQRLNGLTTPLVSALVAAPDGALFAGSLNAELFHSQDDGMTWARGTQGWDAEGTVTGMAVSPNYMQDGTVFASLDGGALMATRNAGKHWEDASFGMSSMTVIAVAVAPSWERYEVLFGATDQGVYVSRNGGRAWRPTTLMLDEQVGVLIVSPDYMNDQTVFAGTESAGLYVSTDQGRNWEQLHEQIGEGALNCVWAAPDFAKSGRLVAGIDDGLYVSSDRGVTWSRIAEMPGAVLALAGNEDVVLAGIHDVGVYKSLDGGQTWVSATGNLAARGLARLIASGGTLCAIGPQEGVFVSQDRGASWRAVEGLDMYLPLSAMALAGDGQVFVASQEIGILRGTATGKSWRVRYEKSGISALLVLAEENLGWAGTAEGELLSSRDGGMSWQTVEEPPTAGQEVLSIVASPGFAEDHTLYMGTAIEGTRVKPARVALWRSRNQGRTWHQIATQETESRWVQITMPADVTEGVADQAVLATGPFCLRPLRRAKDVWISTAVDPNGANVLSVVAIGEIDSGAVLYAATGNGVYSSTDSGRTWQTFSEGMAGQSIIGLVLLDEEDARALYAMSLGGLIFRRQLA
jgi:photosystem II stability/assembly factor-like uncharacterized protein